MVVLYITPNGELKRLEGHFNETLNIHTFVFTDDSLVVGVMHKGVRKSTLKIKEMEQFLCTQNILSINVNIDMGYFAQMGRELTLNESDLFNPLCCSDSSDKNNELAISQSFDGCRTDGAALALDSVCYFDGDISYQMGTKVFKDKALTTPLADGSYRYSDGSKNTLSFYVYLGKIATLTCE